MRDCGGAQVVPAGITKASFGSLRHAASGTEIHRRQIVDSVEGWRMLAGLTTNSFHDRRDGYGASLTSVLGLRCPEPARRRVLRQLRRELSSDVLGLWCCAKS